MTILVIAPTPFFSHRGTHIRILEEANALARRGHDIHIATYHIGGDAGMMVEGGLLHKNVHIHRIRPLAFWYTKTSPGASWVKPFLDLQLIFLSRKLVRTLDVDAIHAHLHEGIAIAWVTRLWNPRAATTSFIGDIHGSMTAEMSAQGVLRAGIISHAFSRFEHWLNARPNHLIASSAGVASSQAQIVLDGGIPLTLSDAERKKRRTAFRAAHTIPENNILITYTGGFGVEKGVEYFIDAAEKILHATNIQSHEHVSFLCAGSPREELDTQLPESLRTHPRFHILSPLSYADLQDVLISSDIGVDPKRAQSSEASGKIANYAAAQLSIVSLRPIAPEYMNEATIIVESPKALPEALLQAVVSVESGVQNTVKTHWTWDAGAEILERLLQ